MKYTEPEIFEEALEHLDIMLQHRLRGDLDDALILDAICLRLASAIEAISRLSAERRASLLGEEWHAMWSTRNHIAHGYADVDAAIIDATLEENIPRVMEVLRRELVE